MFERFTDAARRTMAMAAEEARGLAHDHIGSEHILLGLLRDDECVAARVLASFGMTLDAARLVVDEAAGPGVERITGRIPFTDHARKALELALREALCLGADHIGTEHILLGLARERDGVAGSLLRECGADSATIGSRVVGMLAARAQPTGSAPAPVPPAPPPPHPTHPTLDHLTERARQAMALSQDEARALRHGYVGTEHLLLGLLREQEGLAARVLRDLDIELDGVRREVARIVAPGEDEVSGELPLTPRTQRILELARREAGDLGRSHIGTEHLLLGMCRDGEGLGPRILDAANVSEERIRNAIMAPLGGPAGVVSSVCSDGRSDLMPADVLGATAEDLDVLIDALRAEKRRLLCGRVATHNRIDLLRAERRRRREARPDV